MSYELSKKLMLASLMTYVFVGYGVHVLRNSAEDVYPFFSWSLFAQVPRAVQESLDAQIISIGGKDIEPVPLQSRPDIFDASGDPSIDVHSEIQRIGRALVSKNQEDVNAHVQKLLPYFKVPASFQVRLVRYDLLEHYKTGAIQTSEVLQRFDILSQ